MEPPSVAESDVDERLSKMTEAEEEYTATNPSSQSNATTNSSGSLNSSPPQKQAVMKPSDLEKQEKTRKRLAQSQNKLKKEVDETLHRILKKVTKKRGTVSVPQEEPKQDEKKMVVRYVSNRDGCTLSIPENYKLW